MSKHYCFTWNNYDDNSLIELQNYEKITYCIFGQEVSSEGTPHYQGYFELSGQVKFSSLKNIFPKIHMELRRGKQQDAINYCKKGNQSHEEWEKFKELGPNYSIGAIVTEWGIPAVTNQGKRTDCDNARALVKTGGMRLLTRKVQSFQAMKVAQAYIEYNDTKRDYKPTVVWIYGETGSGKSVLANKLACLTNKHDVYRKNDGTKWWPGYDGHETIIIDDFRDTWWSMTETLSLLDANSKNVEVKGANRQFKGRNIWITSIYHPNSYYKNTDEPIEQLLRRIDTIIYMNDHPECMLEKKYEMVENIEHKNINREIEEFLNNTYCQRE